MKNTIVSDFFIWKFSVFEGEFFFVFVMTVTRQIFDVGTTESSRGTFLIAMVAKFLYADNEDSDQTTRIKISHDLVYGFGNIHAFWCKLYQKVANRNSYQGLKVYFLTISVWCHIVLIRYAKPYMIMV